MSIWQEHRPEIDLQPLDCSVLDPRYDFLAINRTPVRVKSKRLLTCKDRRVQKRTPRTMKLATNGKTLLDLPHRACHPLR